MAAQKPASRTGRAPARKAAAAPRRRRPEKPVQRSARRAAPRPAPGRDAGRPRASRIVDPPPLPPRARDGHKGVFGHVFVLAGSLRYTGAAVLAARAALRTGCGLVTIGCPKSAHPAISGHLLCEMSVSLPDAAAGVFSREAVSEVLDWSERTQAVVLGPGITMETPALQFAQDVALMCPLPMVLDADGLNAFAGASQRLEFAEGPRVLTPHPGEAARLLGCTPPEVVADREGAAIRIAREANAVVLLKGAGTIVTDAERIYVNRSGNSGLATAGSGDVLSGVIGSLLAQGMPAFEAAALGAWIHGRAGDLAAGRLGEHGMIASDVLDHVPGALLEHVRRR